MPDVIIKDPILRKNPHPVTGQCEPNYALDPDGFCYPVVLGDECPEGYTKELSTGNCVPE